MKFILEKSRDGDYRLSVQGCIDGGYTYRETDGHVHGRIERAYFQLAQLADKLKAEEMVLR